MNHVQYEYHANGYGITTVLYDGYTLRQREGSLVTIVDCPNRERKMVTGPILKNDREVAKEIIIEAGRMK